MNVFIPENAKMPLNSDLADSHEPSLKFPAERIKEWADIGLHELLGNPLILQLQLLDSNLPSIQVSTLTLRKSTGKKSEDNKVLAAAMVRINQ